MFQNGQTEPVRHKAPTYSCCVALRIIWIGDINLSTYREIAKMAGVSVSTVSKALSGYGEISQDTKDTIYLIAKQSVYFEKRKAIKELVFLIKTGNMKQAFEEAVNIITEEILNRERKIGRIVCDFSVWEKSC